MADIVQLQDRRNNTDQFPVTITEAVVTPDGTHLSEILPDLAHLGHTHTKSEITDFPTTDSLLAGLPSWTAVPSDSTKLIRRDTGGSAAFGQITFLTVWNYIKDKADAAYAAASHAHAFSALSSRGEAYLEWGGKHIAGSFAPIDAALNPVLGANRLAGFKVAGITVQYSADGGASWTDYGLSDADKVALLTTSATVKIAGPDAAAGSTTADHQLRIELDGVSGGVYTNLNKLQIYLSTNGSTSPKVTMESYDYNSSTEWHSVIAGQAVSGWSGWNILNFSLPGTKAFGGSNQNTHQRKIRLTFTHTGCSASYTGLTVYKIYGYGGVGWATPSTLAANGVPYSYDYQQNVTFPASVKATAFTGALTGNVTGNCSGSSASCTGNAATATKVGKSLTFNNGGAGAASGTTFNGSTARTISYNTIGAAAASHTHTKAQISDFPSSLPASDVPAWAKEAAKPSYTPAEVGAAAATHTHTKSEITDFPSITDTKNTAGASNTSSKIYLIGATSQSAYPQTYSHDTCYVGTDGHLYSNGKKVAPLDSPTFSGVPNTPTAAAGTNTTQIASTAFVHAAVAGMVDCDATGTKPAGSMPVWSGSGNTLTTQTGTGSATKPIFLDDGVPTTCTYELNQTVPSNAVFTDTKNTAGATNTSSKIYLVGATSQAASPQTYTHDTCYVGTDGHLYSNSKKVAPLDSPDFTGTPLAQTAAAGTTTRQIATTAFVVNEITARMTGNSDFVFVTEDSGTMIGGKQCLFFDDDYELGPACACGVTGTLDNSNNLITSAAVKAAIGNATGDIETLLTAL